MSKRILFLFLITINALPAGYAAVAVEDLGQSQKSALLLPLSAPGQSAISRNSLLTETGLPPFQESAAYQQYVKRPKSELSKLIYLLDRLKKSNFTILYNKRPYKPQLISLLVKQYLLMNYKKETAEEWIGKHAYRSRSKGAVIYVEYPDGKTCELRKILLEELTLIS